MGIECGTGKGMYDGIGSFFTLFEMDKYLFKVDVYDVTLLIIMWHEWDF